MTFFVMNLACFLLKIGSAPNFRPGFKFFNWQTAFLGSVLSAAAMFFIDETYAVIAICVLVLLFLLIHYLCPPKRWGDVSQNLIYHQVRKYLLRLKPEHIKFWRPHIILLINDPRRQTRLIQFCNSMKKGSLYILGHVIVTDDFATGVHEAKLQQHAWTNYISEFSRVKAFVQLTMSPSLNWGIRNLILSAGLGGMRPNIAVLGFYNMEDLRRSRPPINIPDIPASPTSKMKKPPSSGGKAPDRRRRDTSARLLEGFLPTDVIRTEGLMHPTEYMTILEDLTLRYRLNVAVAHGFETLETPKKQVGSTKRYVDLWPIQMSAEVSADGKNVVTTNFDTCKDIPATHVNSVNNYLDTLILQLGHILHSVQTWRRAYKLRVMLFVEYESEVEEERARVKALLEKLRIDAEVVVFWLASGQLNTYELIINGNSNDIDWEIIVSDALKDEDWWDDLQMFRGRSENISSAQELTELAHIIDSVAGRPGTYNLHGENDDERRRSSTAGISELPRKPAISDLSKIGVSVGMHTNHLSGEMLLQESSSEGESDSEEEDIDSEDEVHFGTGPGFNDSDPVREPLLLSEQSTQHKRDGESSEESSVKAGRVRKSKTVDWTAPMARSYGTISTTKTLTGSQELPPNSPEAVSQNITDVMKESQRVKDTELSKAKESKEDVEQFPRLEPPGLLDDLHGPRRSRSLSPLRTSSPKPLRDGTSTPMRPGVSRQSSSIRFSSRPMPETTVTNDGEGSVIGFANQTSVPDTPKAEKPTFSRQSSYGKFSSRPVPETKMTADESGSRTITFAEQPIYVSQSPSHSRHHSRHGSSYSNFAQGEISFSIPELLDSCKTDEGMGDAEAGGSAYSTQGVALSFNDLTSRAQHLILNELMRQNSAETAVILTTLPIPSDGTSLDDDATIRYLSDVEVLCNELPPVLMVLSNSMTVTVSL